MQLDYYEILNSRFALEYRYGRKAINEDNKLRLKALALNRGVEGVLGPQVVVRKRVRKSILGFKFGGGNHEIQDERTKLPAGLKSKSGKKFGKRASFFGNLFSSSSKDIVSPSDSNSSTGSPINVPPPQRNKNKMSSKAAKLLGMATQEPRKPGNGFANEALDPSISRMATAGQEVPYSPIDTSTHAPFTPKYE